MNSSLNRSVYLDKVISEFELKNDPRLSDILSKLQTARSEGRINYAVEHLITDLLAADSKNALTDLLAVLPMDKLFDTARNLIKERIFRAAAHELSQLVETAKWKPSEEQLDCLHRFYLYYAG